jgi:hypothetical protein
MSTIGVKILRRAARRRLPLRPGVSHPEKNEQTLDKGADRSIFVLVLLPRIRCSGKRPPSCPVPSKAFTRPAPRSIDRGAVSGRGEGARKEFRSRVAGNPLQSLDSRSNMEGIGSNFQCFGSSLTRPGRFPDASLKTPGAWLEPRVHERGVGGAARRARRREMAPQRLEKVESAPGDGMAAAGSDPQHLVPERAATVAPKNSRRLSPDGRGTSHTPGAHVSRAAPQVDRKWRRNPLESRETRPEMAPSSSRSSSELGPPGLPAPRQD